MDANQPPPAPEIPENTGSFAGGCLLGCLIQAVIAVLTISFMLSHPSSSRGFVLVAFTQWILPIPLILKVSSDGKPDTSYGMIVSTVIAGLLATTCAASVMK